MQRGPEGIQRFGQSRPDWAILAALAEKWQVVEGRGDHEGSPEAGQGQGGQAQGAAPTVNVSDWKRKKRKARQGPTAKPWNYPNAQAVLEEIGKAAPAYAGMRWESLGDAGVQWSVAAMARAARASPKAPRSPRWQRRTAAASISSAKACCGMAASSCSTLPNRCAA